MYIANHIIMHNCKSYQKGDELKNLTHEDAQYLLKNRAIIKYGKSPEQEAAEDKAAEEKAALEKAKMIEDAKVAVHKAEISLEKEKEALANAVEAEDAAAKKAEENGTNTNVKALTTAAKKAENAKMKHDAAAKRLAEANNVLAYLTGTK
jgi:hypothetical protein